jgi:CxxC-x17-CxxC domain-containing protein
MLASDAPLICRDCDRQFTFSADERRTFAARGHTHPPSRCAACRAARKTRHDQTGYRLVPPAFRELREPGMMPACASCGLPAPVPFAVRGRPVYCSACFQRRRASVPQS